MVPLGNIGLVRLGTLNKSPSAALCVLAHEYIHARIREPRWASSGLAFLTHRSFVLDRSLPGLQWEFRVWAMAERLLRFLDPKGFRWSEFYNRRRSVMRYELRRLARSL